MKEKEFEDIGKRLREAEAEPPKNAWKNIRSSLHESDKPGMVVWLKKHWWKPMLLLIPALIYMYQTNLNDRNAASSSLTPTAPEVAPALKQNTDTNTETSALETATETITVEPDNRIKESTSQLTEQTENSISKNVSDEVHGGKKNEKNINESEMVKPTTINAGQKLILMEDTGKKEQFGKNKLNEPNSGLVDDKELKSTDTVRNHSGENKKSLERISEPEDSAQVAVANEPFQLTDSTQTTPKNEEDKYKENGSWRLTAAYMPQFSTQTIKPFPNDEVLVTEIHQGQRTQRMGYSLAMGVGRAITSRFYVDGQFTFSSLQQDVKYTYADGSIDTLITVQQADEVYLVSPVYHTENREVSAQYKYAGLRLAATYYFWATTRSRFNLTASMSTLYLTHANVKEYVGGEWVSLPTKDLNTMNYSFSTGAGYNYDFGQGWELMINPTLTWYLKEVKDKSLPFSLRQEALGLNFMLSKTLGKQDH